MSTTTTDVLIVGAGPTGLTLATALAVRGIWATVVDRQLRPLRNTLLRLLACIPSFRHRLAWRLSGLAYR